MGIKYVLITKVLILLPRKDWELNNVGGLVHTFKIKRLLES